MIVDTSALIAIMNQEPGAQDFADAIDAAEDVRMSAATLVEACLVADSAADGRYSRGLDQLVRESKIEILPFTAEHAAIAREAHRLFGRGAGSAARLNFGDCFVYATAYAANEPLLYKGNDFSHTDIKSALEAN